MVLFKIFKINVLNIRVLKAFVIINLKRNNINETIIRYEMKLYRN